MEMVVNPHLVHRPTQPLHCRRWEALQGRVEPIVRIGVDSMLIAFFASPKRVPPSRLRVRPLARYVMLSSCGNTTSSQFDVGATINLAHGFTYLSELLGLGGLCLGFWGPRNFVILRDFLWLPTNPNQPIWSGLDGLGPALRWDVASRLKLFSSCLQMAKPLGGA
eukprot:CAMPEP_0117685754 /NCGR_PEP_ID=MMETSP0804-20121206/21965_1 /TAXON_ID=1074897 /ORGANISM="Tetraselmis astigmatica, Strain CCMP880" /LENGTH=164 /DNA_ID=CAMNT_0005497161 /DNA_START=163 /DNA_END=658 /DNA_ORIENTATION=-